MGANTYSMLSINGTVNGPGGAFPIGAGVGLAKEGISVEMLEDKDAMTAGSDGAIMHSLRGSNAGRIVVRILKTSPINAQLNALYNFQRLNAANWGQNVIQFNDTVRGDVITATEMAFTKQPVITYAEDAGMNEWSFQGSIDQLLGTGTPSSN
jgi:hypothetical protein